MGEIKINGKMYPIRLTMGAMKRFKEATGRDFKDIGNDMQGDDMIKLLWCCVQSACKADGIDLTDVTEDDFCDGIDLMKLVPLMQMLGLQPAEAASAEEKKS